MPVSWSTVLIAPLLYIISIPYDLVYFVLSLLQGLLSLPRFIHRWCIHRSVLESRYHSPNAYALITGSSDGLGKALAQELASHGWNLILHGRNPLKLDNVAEELKSKNESIDIRLLVADCTQPQELFSLFDHNLQDLKGPITVLINNAGYLHPQRRFTSLQPEEVETSVLTNCLFPSIMTLRWLAPSSRRASTGAGHGIGSDENTALLTRDNEPSRVIINISSMASLFATPGSSIYSPSKSYLTHFSENLPCDLQSNIEVLNVLVGPMASAMWRNRRNTNIIVSKVHDVANAVIGAVGLGIPGDGIWAGYNILDMGPSGGGGVGIFTSPTQQLILAGGDLLPSILKAWVADKVYKFLEWEEH